MDRVLFMESFCHGFDKPGTFSEAVCVLKPGGSLFISDIFYVEVAMTMTKILKHKSVHMNAVGFYPLYLT
jgi:hypothetical protein